MCAKCITFMTQQNSFSGDVRKHLYVVVSQYAFHKRRAEQSKPTVEPRSDFESVPTPGRFTLQECGPLLSRSGYYTGWREQSSRAESATNLCPT